MEKPKKIYYKKQSVKCIFSTSSSNPKGQIDPDTNETYGREIINPNRPPSNLFPSKIIQKKSKEKAKEKLNDKAEKLKEKLIPEAPDKDDACYDDLEFHPQVRSCVLIGRKFISLEEKLKIDSKLRFSNSRNVSQLFTFSFLVLNLGKHRAIVSLQISPDNKRWLKDSLEVIIEPSDIVAITANNFANFTRLALKATRCESEIRIWFQGQI